MAKEEVAIVGGGIGGLTAALALIREGIDVEVHEQAPELKELGAGVQISSNGTRVLYALGLGAACEKVGVVVAGKEIRLWSTGQTWKLFDLGADFGRALRLSLHRCSTAATCTRCCSTRSAARSPTRSSSTANAPASRQQDGMATMTFENGETATAPLVIGADGVQSRVRLATFGADRAGVHRHRRLADPGAARAGAGRHPVGRSAPTGSGRAGTWCTIRCAAAQFLNFVGLLERDDWRVEILDRAGQQGRVHQRLPQLASRHPRDDPRQVDTPYKWALFARPPMPAWTKGRVTLLGDACHSMLPMMAQGAVMALEDGYVLARCIRKYGVNPEALAALRGGAARARQPRAWRLRSTTPSASTIRKWHMPPAPRPM